MEENPRTPNPITYTFEIDKLAEARLRTSYEHTKRKVQEQPDYTPEFRLHHFDSFEDLKRDALQRIEMLFNESVGENRSGLEELSRVKLRLGRPRNYDTTAWYSPNESTREEAVIGINYWRALRMPYQISCRGETIDRTEEFSQFHLGADIRHELDHARDIKFLQYRRALLKVLKGQEANAELLPGFKLLLKTRTEGVASFNEYPFRIEYILNRRKMSEEELANHLKGVFLTESKLLSRRNWRILSGVSRKNVNPHEPREKINAYKTGDRMMALVSLNHLMDATGERDLGKLILMGHSDPKLEKSMVWAAKQDVFGDAYLREFYDRYYSATRKFGIEESHMLIPKGFTKEILKLELNAP